jgi:hypothetical protein
MVDRWYFFVLFEPGRVPLFGSPFRPGRQYAGAGDKWQGMLAVSRRIGKEIEMNELFLKIPGTFPARKRVRAVCVVCVR